MFTLTPNRTRACGSKDCGYFLDSRPAHKSYVVADPDDLAEKLRARGAEARVLSSNTKRSFLSSATAILEARFPEQGFRDYVPASRAYLDHRGRSRIKLAAGPVRLICENSFMNPVTALHHCSRAAREFVADPYSALLAVSKLATINPERIEDFRNVYGGYSCLSFLGTVAPRLRSKVFRFWPEYAAEGGEDSVWTFLQCATAPHNARLEGFVSRCLADSEACNTLLSGAVPTWLWN